MNIRNTYWLVSVSLLLSFSLALPVCCNADISKLFAHHQEMGTHAGHGQHADANTDSCSCGHELAQDFQKTKKVVTGQNVSSLLTILLPQEFITRLVDQSKLYLVEGQPAILTDASPPIHLLNSVFLH